MKLRRWYEFAHSLHQHRQAVLSRCSQPSPKAAALAAASPGQAQRSGAKSRRMIVSNADQLTSSVSEQLRFASIIQLPCDEPLLHLFCSQAKVEAARNVCPTASLVSGANARNRCKDRFAQSAMTQMTTLSTPNLIAIDW